jgi:hypothetical protein
VGLENDFCAGPVAASRPGDLVMLERVTANAARAVGSWWDG